MIEFPHPSPEFQFRIDPMQSQRFRIMARGPGVLLFEANAPQDVPDPDAITPDPMQFLSQMVAQGFLPPAHANGPLPALRIETCETDLATQTQIWDMAAENLAPGAFRVLANMLVAREMEEIAVIAPDSATLNPASLSYPALTAPILFQIDYQPPAMMERERSVEIWLNSEPDDAELDSLYDILGQWCKFLLLGAYPRDGQSPLASGLFPDLAILAEPNCVMQGIEIAFACDELAFVPLITALHHWRGRLCAIQCITIR